MLDSEEGNLKKLKVEVTTTTTICEQLKVILTDWLL